MIKPQGPNLQKNNSYMRFAAAISIGTICWCGKMLHPATTTKWSKVFLFQKSTQKRGLLNKK